MKSPLWVIELADSFWKSAGFVEPFPRSLRHAALRVFEGMVVYLPSMRLEHVKTWLREKALPCPCELADRPLRACLVARSGWAVVFIDVSDPEDEQRFSLAHELAHFLRDYWQPRQLACQRLGRQILQVLDGERPPTPAERLHSLVAHVPIGFHVHLMERREDGGFGSRAIADAEGEADRLAFELLAPVRTLVPHVKRGKLSQVSLARLLEGQNGFPAAQAAHYAKILLPPPRPRDPVLERLFGK